MQEKKPLSGYMLFCKYNREAAKTKIPKGLESKAVMPAIAKVREKRDQAATRMLHFAAFVSLRSGI